MDCISQAAPTTSLLENVKPYFPLLAALLGAIVAGYVNSLFKFYELRFEMNVKKRTNLLNLWASLNDALKMLELNNFYSFWQDPNFRLQFNQQIMEAKKRFEGTSGNILKETVDVYDYIFHIIRLNFLLPSISPDSIPKSIKSITEDIRAKLSFMRELIETDCGIDSINKLLYKGFWNFIFSVDKSPKRLNLFLKKNKTTLDQIENFFREKNIKTIDEP